MADKGKTVLILGNGFDLAHGLPTKYAHFLEFCKRVEKILQFDLHGANSVQEFKRTCIDNWQINKSISEAIVTAYENRKIERTSNGKYVVISDNSEVSEMNDLLKDNVWYKYFTELYHDHCMKGENWIDFESEIRFVIKEVDENALSLTSLWSDVLKNDTNFSQDQKLEKFRNELKFFEFIQRKGLGSDYKATVRDFREKTFEDLERLTRALELYLAAFVAKIPIDDSEKIPEISRLTPDYVINFNYTDTYERIYKKGEVYHVHGEANEKRPAEENNMVLGIDEYWVGDEQDERTNFTVFKKFSQRIQKHTGNGSYKCLQEMQKLFQEKGNSCSSDVDKLQENSDGVSSVYVFGHSLDVTDKDILSNFIGDDSTSVVIYCLDKGTEGDLIGNTIKLISEKKLLDKANHVPPKLQYVIQKGT